MKGNLECDDWRDCSQKSRRKAEKVAAKFAAKQDQQTSQGIDNVGSVYHDLLLSVSLSFPRMDLINQVNTIPLISLKSPSLHGKCRDEIRAEEYPYCYNEWFNRYRPSSKKNFYGFYYNTTYNSWPFYKHANFSSFLGQNNNM